MMKKKLDGIYLVIDPAADQSTLAMNVRLALESGVNILQIWNHWPHGSSRSDKEQLINAIAELAGNYKTPVLINEHWQLLKTTRVDGVHFDDVPDDLESIKSVVRGDFIAGITCSNDLAKVRWADEQGFDYISFCAMFPSPSVSNCTIVRPQTVREARKMTDLPLFLSGGITPERIGDNLATLDFDGVAVISGILGADKPGRQTLAYKKALAGNQN